MLFIIYGERLAKEVPYGRSRRLCGERNQIWQTTSCRWQRKTEHCPINGESFSRKYRHVEGDENLEEKEKETNRLRTMGSEVEKN